MKLPLTLLLSSLISFPSVANNIICSKIGGEYSTLRVIAWNTESLVATLKNDSGDELKGKVTGVRKRRDGEKVNMLFEHNSRYYGPVVSEFMVFPDVKSGNYRAIGVTSVKSEDLTLLDTFDGNTEISCVTL